MEHPSNAAVVAEPIPPDTQEQQNCFENPDPQQNFNTNQTEQIYTETIVQDALEQNGASWDPITEFKQETTQNGSVLNGDESWLNSDAEPFVPAAGQMDYGQVAPNAKDQLQDIVDTDYAQSSNGLAGGDTLVQDFPHVFSYKASPGVTQRRPYEFPEDSPSSQFQVPSGKAAMLFSNGRENNGLDSPMAEFDVEKRRNNSLGPQGARPRRSRPLGQHVRDLVFWRNVKDSGVIFSFGLILLLSLSYFSIISIFAYLSMTALIIVTSFVLIKQVTMAFQQQTSEHPFKQVLDKDVVINPDYAHQQLDTFLKPFNGMMLRVRNLYLADSLGQTLKFILAMYILTYVGAWFNLLTLLTIVWVAAFTVPKCYITYKEQIDSVIEVVLEGLRDLKLQISRGVNKQITKIKSSGNRHATNVVTGVEGQIRSRNPDGKEKVEAEIKTEDGKVSAKYEKKVSGKAH